MDKNITKKIYSTLITTLLISVGLIAGQVLFQEKIVGKVKGGSLVVDPNGSTNYSTIQSAIDNASAGDIIYVWAGTYYENLVINKSITLMGNSSSNTTIYGGFIDHVININANGVRINGFYIIYCSSTIEHAGIFFNGSTFCYVENCIITDNINGILIKNSSNITISNNAIDFNEYGIYIELSKFIFILKNEISANIVGLRLVETKCCQIQNNYCDSNYNVGIGLQRADNNKVSNNIINDTRDGVSIYNSNWNSFDNNSCNWNNYGYYLFNSNNNKIKFGNNTGNSNGIRFNEANYNELENISFSSNDVGIYLYPNSNYNLIVNNSVKFNYDYGIELRATTGNIILNNNISNNYYAGLVIYDSNNSMIDNNVFEGHYDAGMYIVSWSWSYIADNIIKRNIFKNNGRGIYLDTYTFNNQIFYNNMISNTEQVTDFGSNTWNNSYQEGNYWSDYTGVDNGNASRIKGDGIGDTNLPHYGLDNYPFVRPSGWLENGPVFLSGPRDICYLYCYNLTWFRARHAIKYSLQIDDNADFETPEQVYEGPELNYEIKGQTPGIYYYRLKAIFGEAEGTWSNIAKVTVHGPPKVPANARVTPYQDGNALIITWDLNEDKTKEYYLYQHLQENWVLLDILPHPINNYNHTELENSKEYYYRIRARDVWDQFSEYSNIIQGTPMDSQPPKTPTLSRLSVISHESIKIVWNKNIVDDDLIGYNIYRGESKYTLDLVNPINGKIPVTENSFIDIGLKELTTYYYGITALDEVPNESELSIILSATTTMGPHPPEILKRPVKVTINEDTSDTSINMFEWFKDINDDILTFRCDGNDNIKVFFGDRTGNLKLVPDPDWNGIEVITFYANDSLFEISDNLTVVVNYVNDPPRTVEIISPTDGTYYNDTDQAEFRGKCYDPDIIYGDSLVFTWYSDHDGRLGFGENLSNIKLSLGLHVITLEVSDGFGLITKCSINIRVVGEFDSGVENNDKVNNENYFTGLVVSLIIIIIIINLILIFILLSRRKNELRETGPWASYSQVGLTEAPVPIHDDNRMKDVSRSQEFDGLSNKNKDDEIIITPDSEIMRWFEPEHEKGPEIEFTQGTEIHWEAEEIGDIEEEFDISELLEE